eukprot:COSAG02_NODE_2956_length_7669_cov_10.857860_8_plen_202_part_00
MAGKFTAETLPPGCLQNLKLLRCVALRDSCTGRGAPPPPAPAVATTATSILHPFSPPPRIQAQAPPPPPPPPPPPCRCPQASLARWLAGWLQLLCPACCHCEGCHLFGCRIVCALNGEGGRQRGPLAGARHSSDRRALRRHLVGWWWRWQGGELRRARSMRLAAQIQSRADVGRCVLLLSRQGEGPGWDGIHYVLQQLGRN